MRLILDTLRYINLCPCLFSHMYHRLRELNEVLQNTPASLKEPHRVRWLSLQEAVVAVSRCWPALVGVFGEDAVNGNAVTHGLSKKVEDFLFMGYTQIFMDALPVITRLSKVPRKELVDYDQFQTQLNATKATVAMMADDDSLDSMPHLKAFMDIPQYEDGLIIHSGIPLKVTDQKRQLLKNIKGRYMNELAAHLDRRFPPDLVNVLSCLNTCLNPRKIQAIPAADLARHGTNELQIIVQHFQQATDVGVLQDGQPVIDQDRLMQDFPAFKAFAQTHAFNRLPAFAEDLLTNYSDIYPDLATLMAYFLTVPLSSVPLKGHSASKTIKRARHAIVSVKNGSTKSWECL